MLAMRSIVPIISLAIVGGAGLAMSQDYPSKPIRIFTGAAGGGNDYTSRQVAQGISGPLGQQVIVDNRGIIGAMDAFRNSPPDGYTLIINGSTLWTNTLLQKMPYDVVRDLYPITSISRDVFVLIVHPSLPVKSVKELIALAKSRPGDINYASVGPGAFPSLAMELFKTMTGV